MTKKRFLLLIVLLTIQRTECFLHDLLVTILALNEFNAINRKAVYNDVAQLWQTTAPDNLKSWMQPSATPVAKPEHVTTFADLAGDIPADIREIPDAINNAEAFIRLGAYVPHGILLYGPGGTGKTSIARAIAGETGAAFFAASATEFIEMYVGVGPQRIRELFDKARAALYNGAPAAIIFIDEIDAIGGTRTGEPNSEYRNTLNELLNQLDGFTKTDNIFVIAATNTISMLDKALLRPGRFDRLVEVKLPDLVNRKAIINHYLGHIVCSCSPEMVDMIAQKTNGLSGAELKNLINEAAVFAAREKVPAVTDIHLEKALEKSLSQKKYR